MNGHFNYGDRVVMVWQGEWVHGEVTVVREDTCKVLFDEDWAPNYDYYPVEDLYPDDEP